MSIETKSGWLRTGVTIASLAAGLVTAYIAVIEQQNNNTKDIATLNRDLGEVKAEQARNRDDQRRADDAISELKGDMKAVRQSLEFLVQSVRQHSFPPARQ